MAHITARIPDEDYKAMKDIAELDMRSFNQVLGFAVKEYVDKHRVSKPVKRKAGDKQK